MCFQALSFTLEVQKKCLFFRSDRLKQQLGLLFQRLLTLAKYFAERHGERLSLMPVAPPPPAPTVGIPRLPLLLQKGLPVSSALVQLEVTQCPSVSLFLKSLSSSQLAEGKNDLGMREEFKLYFSFFGLRMWIIKRQTQAGFVFNEIDSVSTSSLVENQKETEPRATRYGLQPRITRPVLCCPLHPQRCPVRDPSCYFHNTSNDFTSASN